MKRKPSRKPALPIEGTPTLTDPPTPPPTPPPVAVKPPAPLWVPAVKPAPSIWRKAAALNLLALLALLWSSGCTMISGETTRTTTNPTNAVAVVELSKLRASTLGGGKQALEAVAVSSTPKSQHAGAKGVEQQSTLADLAELLRAIAALKPTP